MVPITSEQGDESGLATNLRIARYGISGTFRIAPVARHFASRLALIAFATAAVRGLIAGADFQGTIQAALVATAVFFGLGFVFGELARRVVEENAEAEFARLNSQTPTPKSQEPA